jgi:general secretion pathway protein E
MLNLLSLNKTPATNAAKNVPLTAEGGVFDRGDQVRSIAVLYGDGRLLVSKSHITSPIIFSLKAEAEISGLDVTIEAVDLSVITESYEQQQNRSSGEGRADDARMRREVIDLVAALSKRRCSDIHIVVSETSCLVRARVAGSLEHVAEWPPEYGHSFCAATFAMADASDVNYQPYEYQGARCSNRKDLKLPPGVASLRLQFNPTVYGGRALIIRLLYDATDGNESDVGALGFSAEQIEDFQLLRSRPFGINIVAGPTGHGKSTTLQRNISAIIKEFNGNIAIFTVEDPPEYIIPGAVQMPVVNANTTEERSEAFTRAIAASLRSNPDRLMIGEIRDAASAKLAFEAAMTGHQVWTTLHSNDAITIPFRLRDLGIEDYKLGDPTLITGLISQRLVRKICPHCRRPLLGQDQLNNAILGRLDAAGIPLESVRLHNPRGCESCGHGNGYAGRTVVAEVIVPDETFMHFVKKDDKLGAEAYWLSHLGGRNMMENMLDRVHDGEVDPRDAERIMGPLVRPVRET